MSPSKSYLLKKHPSGLQVEVTFHQFGEKNTRVVRVSTDGSVDYWSAHEVHRKNGPAAVSKLGIIRFFEEGRTHREDGPSLYLPGGGVYYFFGKSGLLSADKFWSHVASRAV